MLRKSHASISINPQWTGAPLSVGKAGGDCPLANNTPEQGSGHALYISSMYHARNNGAGQETVLQGLNQGPSLQTSLRDQDEQAAVFLSKN